MTERSGEPIVGALTEGQWHERPQAIPLLERMWPDAVAGDEGYNATTLQTLLQEREIEAVLPQRVDETGPNDDDADLYRECPLIEQTINRLKRWRRIATRSEKRAANYLALVMIAMTLDWRGLCKHTLVKTLHRLNDSLCNLPGSAISSEVWRQNPSIEKDCRNRAFNIIRCK